MAVRYGYFNSVDGDRKYNAEDMTMYFKGLVSDGIYQTIGNMFAVTATSGLTVSIGTGRALVNMHWIECDASFTITFDAASVSSDTYQLIVLRCNLADDVRSVGVFTKTSSDGSISLTNNDTITELCIARVRIRANASSISQSDIRDYRGSSYCPWITGLVKQVDVSQLNAQFYKYYEEQTAELEAYMAEQKTSFDNWLSSLQSELTVNTTLKTFQSIYKTTAETKEIPLIAQYEAGDSLLVHIGGVLFVEGTEFTIDIENQKIVLTNSVTANNTITQYLTKSVIGGTSWATLEYPESAAKAFSINSCLTSVEIPEGTEVIAPYAFYNCDQLESIEIPDSVNSLGWNSSSEEGYVFYKCKNLKTVKFPNNEDFDEIYQYTFDSCISLESVEIPASVDCIDKCAFSYCKNLKTLTFGENSLLDIVGESAFTMCYSLTNVTLPQGTRRIENYAFCLCSSLTEITIPDSVTFIGNGVFKSCSNLTELHVPSSVTTIGTNAFEGIAKVYYSGTATGSPWGATEIISE